MKLTKINGAGRARVIYGVGQVSELVSLSPLQHHSLDSDNIPENPAHRCRRNQHNGTTHLAILLNDIPENLGPRTITA
ncbi:hypothetical protein DVH24_008005 [Malus domestica]|uniref:Uncharacterized protein n=1 Tax=Malus domestica TaxID=3750 RepID=A0A498JKG2_MALDO|nr:hypothetical protein DVH24_008005 [Malus domestica]